MTIKQFIKIREDLELTQGKLAYELGLNRKTVNFIENGLSKISKRTELAMNQLKVERL